MQEFADFQFTFKRMWKKNLNDPKINLVGYADMVGDLLHCGHIRFLQQCKSYCDYLVVGIDNDVNASENKRKPIIRSPYVWVTIPSRLLGVNPWKISVLYRGS